MAETKTLTFAVMDPPFETARSTTLLRLLDIAVRRGHNINVFAYEGAVYLPFALQKAHPNPAHGRNAEEENHVLTKDLIAGDDGDGGASRDQVRLGQLRHVRR